MKSSILSTVTPREPPPSDLADTITHHLKAVFAIAGPNTRLCLLIPGNDSSF